jgi:excisionase family DNA binding protein
MPATVERRKLAGNLLTVQEAAKALAVCRSTLYSLMDSGELTYVRIGTARVRRVPLWAVEELLEAGLVGPQV